MFDTLLIGFDSTNGPDVAVLVVGRRIYNGETVVINAFKGKEAEELYSKLVTPSADMKGEKNNAEN